MWTLLEKLLLRYSVHIEQDVVANVTQKDPSQLWFTPSATSCPPPANEACRSNRKFRSPMARGPTLNVIIILFDSQLSSLSSRLPLPRLPLLYPRMFVGVASTSREPRIEARRFHTTAVSPSTCRPQSVLAMLQREDRHLVCVPSRERG